MGGWAGGTHVHGQPFEVADLGHGCRWSRRAIPAVAAAMELTAAQKRAVEAGPGLAELFRLPLDPAGFQSVPADGTDDAETRR